jgi:hypothetical protein
MSSNEGQEKMQTLGQAESSVTGVVQSSFTSLAKMLGIPQLKESFYQNIIYILMTIVVMVGILVYVQIVSGNGNGSGAISSNPLFSPPTKEVKKVEIKRIVEGFSLTEGMDTTSSAADVNSSDVGGGEENIPSLHDAYVEPEHYGDKNKKKK